MNFACAAVKQPADGILELRSSNNRIFGKHQPPAVDEVPHRDELHAGDQIPRILFRRHETVGPGRSVFYEGAGVRNPSRVCVTLQNRFGVKSRL